MSLPIKQYLVPSDYAEPAKTYKDLAKLHERSQKQHAHELQFHKDKLKPSAAKIFGAESDGVVVSLFNEAELSPEVEDAEDADEPEVEMKGDGKPRKKKRKTIPDHLPRNRIEDDLDENQKICVADGANLVKIGEEIREEVDYIPAKIIVSQHVYLKYCCPCCASGVHRANTIMA